MPTVWEHFKENKMGNCPGRSTVVSCELETSPYCSTTAAVQHDRSCKLWLDRTEKGFGIVNLLL